MLMRDGVDNPSLSVAQCGTVPEGLEVRPFFRRELTGTSLLSILGVTAHTFQLEWLAAIMALTH